MEVVDQDKKVLFRYRVFRMKDLSGQNDAEKAIGKMLCGFGDEYEVLRSSDGWQTHSFEYKKGYKKWGRDSLNSMMQKIWAEYEFEDALKNVDSKGGWQKYYVGTGNKKAVYLEYNQDTLDQSDVGKIPYMYLRQSDNSYVVVVIQRELPR